MGTWSVYLNYEEEKILMEKYKEAKKLNPDLPKNHFLRNLIRQALGLEPIMKPKEKLMYELFGDIMKRIDANTKNIEEIYGKIAKIVEALEIINKRLEMLEKRTPGLDKMLKKQEKDKKGLEELLEKLR